MKNFIAPGTVLEVVAAGAIVSGQLVEVGSLVGVAVKDAAVGETVALNLCGVYEVPKAAGAIAQGAKVYFVSETANIDDTDNSGANTFVGYAYKAALNGDATVQVLLAN